MKKIILLVLLLLASLSLRADITVIPLNRSDAGQLLPVIASQLGEGSSVNVWQNQLILNATADETAAIKKLIAQLDNQGRALLISVKSDSADAQQQSHTQVSISHTQNARSETRITTTSRTLGSSGSDSALQSIRATEGLPSLISIGQSRLYSNPDGSQQWQAANQQFYATARVNGNVVSIRIEQQDAAFTGQTRMQNQQLSTQVSGSLGQWILIGSLAGQTRQQTSGLSSTQHRGERFYLKVDLLSQ